MLSVSKIFKYNWNLILKRTNIWISTKTCFVYFALAEKVENSSLKIQVLFQIDQRYFAK